MWVTQLPDTVTYKTPGGGRRYLYRISEKDSGKTFHKASNRPEGEEEHAECALLGQGQYTVLPYSIHRNGGVYKFYRGKNFKEIDIAIMPNWMREKMLNSPSPKTKREKGNNTVKKDKNIETVTSNFPEFFTPCPTLKGLYEEQIEKGLDYDSWNNVITLLAQIGGFEQYIIEFSELNKINNTKNDEELIDSLLEKYKENAGNVPTLRCTTFGCGKKEIRECFKKVHRNDQKEITNSPASKIKSSVSEKKRVGVELKWVKFDKEGEPYDFNPSIFVEEFLKDNPIKFQRDRGVRAKIEDGIFYIYEDNYWKIINLLPLHQLLTKYVNNFLPHYSTILESEEACSN